MGRKKGKIDPIKKMEIQDNIRKHLVNPNYWHTYNLAKTQEKRLVYRLLYELCQLIPEPLHTNGRPPVPIKDLVFSLGLKLYSNYSGRKVSSDLHHAQMAGFISRAPHFNTLNDFLNCPASFDLLRKLLTVSALPLKNLEDSFSLDSSGFGTNVHERWKKVRSTTSLEKVSLMKSFLKGHICIGTRTNVIVSCEISSGYGADAPYAEPLLKVLGDNFNAREVSADKAYCSKRIFQIVQSIGALPFIPFKENSIEGENSPEIWRRMFRYFKKHTEEFLKFYHKRSNVETVFSMIKVRLGEHLKGRNLESQKNELVMKFIIHNICCLVQEIFENGVHIDFKICLEKLVDRRELGHVPLKKKNNRVGKIKF